jgi:tetratricopeptide (TPR) repeat protein
MHHLAMGYHDAGEPKKALPLMEQALELHRAKLGTDHNSTLVCLNNTALVYSALARNDDAARLYEETLAILRRKGRTDHPDMLPTLTSLGTVYRDLGQRDKAVPLLERALEFVQTKAGRDHPDTLYNRGILAACYRETGRPDKALSLLDENYKVAKAELGADAPAALDAQHLLAVGYGETGQGEKAATTFADLLAVSRKRLSKGSPAVAGLLDRASVDLLRFGQYAVAEGYLHECLEIRERKESDAWTTFNTRSMLGGALLGQKKYADAEPLLVKGYEGLKAREKAIPPQAATRIPEALDLLIEFYTAAKKPDEVKKYRDLRAEYPPEVAPMPRAVK